MVGRGEQRAAQRGGLPGGDASRPGRLAPAMSHARESSMGLSGWAKLLRVFVGEADRIDGRPLYERIVETARTEGLAGATVLRGGLSFGAASHMHSAQGLRLSQDL